MPTQIQSVITYTLRHPGNNPTDIITNIVYLYNYNTSCVYRNSYAIISNEIKNDRFKKSLKIPNLQSESVNKRGTDNTMTKDIKGVIRIRKSKT